MFSPNACLCLCVGESGGISKGICETEEYLGDCVFSETKEVSVEREII